MNYVADTKKWEQRRISLKCGDTFTVTDDNEIRAFRAVTDGSCRPCCLYTPGARCPLNSEYLNIGCSSNTHFIEIDPNSIVEDIL